MGRAGRAGRQAENIRSGWGEEREEEEEELAGQDNGGNTPPTWVRSCTQFGRAVARVSPRRREARNALYSPSSPAVSPTSHRRCRGRCTGTSRGQRL